MGRHNTPRKMVGAQSQKSVAKNTILVDDRQLQPLNQTRSLPAYLKSVWSRKDFISKYAKNSAFSIDKDTALGKAWLVLDPILQVLLYWLVFGVILKTSRGIDHYLSFLIVGVIYFRCVSQGISTGSGLLQRERNLITSFHFPTGAIVVSHWLRLLLDNLIPATLALLMAFLLAGNIVPGPVFLLAPVTFAIMQFFILGCMLIVSRLTLMIPDLKPIIALCIRGLFFISGIFFSIDRFDGHPALNMVVELNPIYQFLNLVRSSVLPNSSFSFLGLGYLSLWAICLLIFGTLYFWRGESKYANHF